MKNLPKVSVSEAYYKSIYRGIGVGIAVIKVAEDNRFVYLGINPAMEKLLGITSAEAQGKTPNAFIGLVGEKVVKETLDDFRACVETRREVTRRGEVLLSGKQRWYIRKLDPVYGPRGKVVGLVSFIMDETECSQVKQALVQAENRYRRIVEDQTEFVVRFLSGGTVTFANNSFCRYFGKKQHELLGYNFYSVFPAAERTLMLKQLGGLSRDRSVATFESPALKSPGVQRWNQWTLRAIYDSRDQIAEYQAVGHDIDNRKRMEAELKDSEYKLRVQNEALEKKNIALQELLEQVEIEKKKIKDNVLGNVERVLFPLIEKLQTGKVSRKYIVLLKSVVEDLASSYGRKISPASTGLSPREVEICTMIKNNLTSKDIAGILNLSLETVERHRANIRTKLGLVKEDVNLTSYLKNI